MGAFTLWCVPAVLNAARTSEAVRGLEYVTLLAGGILFWWPLHAPSQEQRMPLVPHSLIYLAAATLCCSLIGISVAFGHADSSSLLNSRDTLHIAESLSTDWSLTQASDKETAGLFFWIGASTVLLTEVMFVYYRWYTRTQLIAERAGTLLSEPS
jgi:cytochrome c oxidase assembly factor CtaG